MSERDVFTAALEIADPTERAAYLDRACAGDPALRRRVELLLHTHGYAGAFLERPAAEPLAADDTPGLGATAALDPAGRPAGAAARSRPGDEEEDAALAFLQASTRPGSLGRLGHYEVLEVLGKGGFGIVLRAFDEALQRVVAIKVMAPHIAATAPARKRFLREARASAAIRHENVVYVYAIEEQPLPYLVMELIPGQTLQQLLDTHGPLEAAEVVRIGVQLARGLAAAHALGLIHRDVKPANVLLEGGLERRAKLTDFGLARAADDASLSQSGTVAGTPLYMAPEQAQGKALDHRADLFSLGSVLYTLCAGHPPFRANSTFAVLKRVAEDTPRPLREVIPEVPVWLSEIIARLHAKEPTARYQTAAEVAAALEGQLRPGATVGAAPVPAAAPPRRRGWWAGPAATVTAAVLLAAVLAWSSWVVSSARQSEQAAHALYLQEQQQKEERTRQAVPALVKAARLAVLNGDFPEARESLRVALDYDPPYPEAHLLRAQMHAADRQFAEACDDLDVYLRQRPADASARQLRDLCAGPRPADVSNLLAAAVLLKAQRLTPLADALWLPLGYRKRMDDAWAGKKLGERVQLSETLGLGMNLEGTGVANLRPLEGVPFAHLSLTGCPVEDVQPLKGMPLAVLHLGNTRVSDLTPLEGMKLVEITLPPGTPKGLELLRKMKSLETINDVPAAEFWKELLDKYRNQIDLGWVGKKLGGRLNVNETGGFSLDLGNTGVSDLQPLEGIPLTALSLTICPVKDLRPLKGMPLTTLHLYACPGVRDLAPLKGMQLVDLNLHQVQATDLTPLKGMPLKKLFLWQSAAVDLRPLEGMPLTYLLIRETGVTDLAPLRGMPLTFFDAIATPVADIAPLKGMPLATLHLGNTKVEDLTPLEGMKLVEIFLPPGTPKGLELLRTMKSLEKINDMPAAEFWKQLDGGKK